MTPCPTEDQLLAAADALRRDLADLRTSLGAPVAHVYSPLEYAWPVFQSYVRRFADGGRPRAVLVGMNPGPWGMVQTGVPFGDPVVVSQWMGLTGAVTEPPATELHPKRPVLGLASPRREVSGSRLFTLAQDAYGGLDAFFRRFWLTNYCPLAFFDADGRNVTPPRLARGDRARLNEVCDRHLAAVVRALAPDAVVGIGAYAEERARGAISRPGNSGPGAPRVGRILHPSPASPMANRGWGPQALRQLASLGLAP